MKSIFQKIYPKAWENINPTFFESLFSLKLEISPSVIVEHLSIMEADSEAIRLAVCTKKISSKTPLQSGDIHIDFYRTFLVVGMYQWMLTNPNFQLNENELEVIEKIIKGD